MRKSILVVVLLFLSWYPGFGQSSVEGYVYDLATNTPLEGAYVSMLVPLLGSSIPTSEDVGQAETVITDERGYFQIAIDPQAVSITVSYLGYYDQFTKIEANQNTYRIYLREKELELAEVVVQGFYNERKLKDTPGAISLLTRKEISSDNNETIITPALNRVPGVFMQSGALNTNRITIRGIGARSPFATQKIRAYLNDIPLTTGVGESTIEDIDLSVINRVEVLKGPASSIYGAGLGGTINLNVDKALQEENSLRTGLTMGSYGLLRSVSTYKYQNQKINLNVNFNTTHSDGYRDNNEFDRNSFSVVHQQYLSDEKVLTFIGNYIQLKAFIPSSIDSATFATNPRAAAGNWAGAEGFEDYDRGLFGVSYRDQLNSKLDMSHAVFYSFRDAMEQRPNPLGNLFEDSHSFGIRSKLGFDHSKGYIQGGFELFNENFESRIFVNDNGSNGAQRSGNDERRWYYNLFAQWDVDITPTTFLTVGLNYNSTLYKLDDLLATDTTDLSGDYTFDGILSPRLALLQKVNDDLNFYGSISHGFSPPTLEETLTPDGLFNPNIQPETGYNYEIGIRGSLFGLKYDASIYHMDIRNLIVTQRDLADNPLFVNAGETSHNGLELDLRYLVSSGSLSTQFWTTYSRYDYTFTEFLDNDEDFSGNQLTGVPEQVFNAGVDLAWKSNWNFSASYLVVDQMPMRDDNSIFSEAYSVMRMKAAYQNSLSKRFDLEVSAGIDNVLDEKYASMININAGSFGGNAPRYFYPGLPRNYFGSVSLSYNFGN